MSNAKPLHLYVVQANEKCYQLSRYQQPISSCEKNFPPSADEGKVKKCKGEKGKSIKGYLSPPNGTDNTKTAIVVDAVALRPMEVVAVRRAADTRIEEPGTAPQRRTTIISIF